MPWGSGEWALGERWHGVRRVLESRHWSVIACDANRVRNTGEIGYRK